MYKTLLVCLGEWCDRWPAWWQYLGDSTNVHFGQRDHSSWLETQLGPAFFRLAGQKVGAWWPCKQGLSLGACWGRVVPFVDIVFNQFGMQHLKCPDVQMPRCLVLDVR